jgi:hypothetical protein
MQLQTIGLEQGVEEPMRQHTKSSLIKSPFVRAGDAGSTGTGQVANSAAIELLQVLPSDL